MTIGIPPTLEEIEEALNWSADVAKCCYSSGTGHHDAEILATAYREAAAERDAIRISYSERVAQLSAHRAVGGEEHDSRNSKFHGYCVVCVVPWPCEYAGNPPSKNDRAEKAESRLAEVEKENEKHKQDVEVWKRLFRGEKAL